MKYNIFIVDAYNLFYKANWITEESVVKYQNEKFHTEGIIGFLNLMDSYAKKFGTEDLQIYWLFDNAKTSIQKYRKSISEDYKKTRTPQPEWFYKELDMLELILKSYRDNSYLFRVKFLEADDYVNKIVDSYLTENDNVLMFSEDSDWCRGLKSNVHQYKDHKIYTKEVFFEINNFEPTYSNICFYKTFYGDKTDNIMAGLNELPKQFFLNIIKNFTNIHEFILAVKNNLIKYLDLGWIKRIIRDQELLITNWNLIEAVDISLAELDSYQVKCKYQENKLKLIYSSLQLLGKVDTKRIVLNTEPTDILNDMLNGMSVGRKKT